MPVDRAFVELGANTRDFDREMDRSEHRFGKSVDSMSARAVHLALADNTDLAPTEKALAGIDDLASHIGLQTGHVGAALAGASGAAVGFVAALRQGSSLTGAIAAGLGRAVHVAETLAISAAKYWAIQKGLGIAIGRAEAANRPMLAAVLSAVKGLHKYSLLINTAFWAASKAVGLVGSALSTALSTAKKLASTAASVGGHALGAVHPGMLALGGAGAVGAGIGFAVKKAADLETMISQVRKTTGLEGGPLKGLVDQLKVLAEVLPGVSTEDLFKIATEAGRLGISDQGVAATLDYVKAIAMMKVAMDDLPVEEAAKGVGNLLHNFGLGSQYTLGFVSALNKLDDTSNATAADILDIAVRSSLAAHQLGLTTSQTLALATAAKEAGVETEVAGTAISQILLKMTSNMGDFAKLAGMSLADFSATLRRDPVSALEAVANAIKNTDPLKVSEALSGLGLDGQRTIQTMTALAGNFDSVRQKAAVADAEMQTGASILRENSIQAGVAEAMLKSLWNIFGLLAAEVGGAFLPAIKAAVEHLGRIFDQLKAGVASGALDAFRDGLAKLMDVLGGIWDDPARGLDLLGAALDVFLAHAQIVADQAAKAFITRFEEAFGKVAGAGQFALGFLGGVSGPGGGMAGMGLGLGSSGDPGREEAMREQLKASEAKLRKLSDDLARKGAGDRARREADQARILAGGKLPGPQAGPDAADAEAKIARDRAEEKAKQDARDRAGAILAGQVGAGFVPGQLDAEMDAVKRSIEAQLEHIKTLGIFPDDEAFARFRKDVEKDMDHRRRQAEAANDRTRKEADYAKDSGELGKDRREALARFFEQVGGGGKGLDIGHSGIEEFGKSVQEAVGGAPDYAKEQRDYLKKLAEIADKQFKLDQDQAAALAILAREAAAEEAM